MEPKMCNKLIFPSPTDKRRKKKVERISKTGFQPTSFCSHCNISMAQQHLTDTNSNQTDNHCGRVSSLLELTHC